MLGGGGGLPMVLSHLMNAGSVVGALRGGRGTHTLPAVIELVLTFALSGVMDDKTSAPVRASWCFLYIIFFINVFYLCALFDVSLEDNSGLLKQLHL